MGCEVRAKPVFRWVGCSFGDGGEGFFVDGPYVFVESGSRSVASGADALEASFVPTLVHSPSLRYGVLEAGGVGAKDYFCSSIDVTVGE